MQFLPDEFDQLVVLLFGAIAGVAFAYALVRNMTLDEWWSSSLKRHPIRTYFLMYLVCLAAVTIASDLLSLRTDRMVRVHSIAYRYLFVLIVTALVVAPSWIKLRNDERRRSNPTSPGA